MMLVNKFPRHVLLRLEFFEGAGTGSTEEIAAIGGLQVEADRIRFHDYRELIFRLLEVAPLRYCRKSLDHEFLGCNANAFRAMHHNATRAVVPYNHSNM